MRTPYAEPMDIKGYDYLFDARSLNNEKTSTQSSLQASYDYNTSIVKVVYNQEEVYSKDLNIFVNALVAKHGLTNRENQLSPEEMTLIDENERIAVKLIFLNISGSTKQLSDTVDTNGIDFILQLNSSKY